MSLLNDYWELSAPRPGERGYRPLGDVRPRLVPVYPSVAYDFCRRWHSKLPEPNFRGVMFCCGVELAGTLRAVALAGTPTATWRTRCEQSAVLELTRIASDGSCLGAASMLAARMIDLAACRGPAWLFVTYSFIGERGTTYKALREKGLRPVARTRFRVRPHARDRDEVGDESLKIRWEAGPLALPAKWELLA